jgi:hypothetical protein
VRPLLYSNCHHWQQVHHQPQAREAMDRRHQHPQAHSMGCRVLRAVVEVGYHRVQLQMRRHMLGRMVAIRVAALRLGLVLLLGGTLTLRPCWACCLPGRDGSVWSSMFCLACSFWSRHFNATEMLQVSLFQSNPVTGFSYALHICTLALSLGCAPAVWRVLLTTGWRCTWVAPGWVPWWRCAWMKGGPQCSGCQAGSASLCKRLR